YGDFLAVAAHAFVAFAFFLFVNEHLAGAFVFKNGGGNGSAIQSRSAKLRVFAFAEGQHLIDGDGGAGFGVLVAVYEKNVAFGNSKLLPLGLDDRFHKKGFNRKPRIGEIKFFLCLLRRFNNISRIGGRWIIMNAPRPTSVYGSPRKRFFFRFSSRRR